MADTTTTTASAEAGRMLRVLEAKHMATGAGFRGLDADEVALQSSDLLPLLRELIELRKWAQTATALMQVHGFKLPPVPQVKA